MDSETDRLYDFRLNDIKRYCLSIKLSPDDMVTAFNAGVVAMSIITDLQLPHSSLANGEKPAPSA